MANIDIARALKDKDYFNSLTPEDQEKVREAGGVGPAEVTDGDLESVSGGLEGGVGIQATTTSGASRCFICGAGSQSAEMPVVCTC